MLSTVLLAFLSTCFCRIPPIHLWHTPPPQQDADDIIDTDDNIDTDDIIDADDDTDTDDIIDADDIIDVMIDNFRELVFERNLDPMMMESPFSTDNFDGFLKEHYPLLHIPLSIAGFNVGELDVSKEHNRIGTQGHHRMNINIFLTL